MHKLFAVCACALLLEGGAAAGVAAIGAGTSAAAGTGIEQTMSGITYKTFTAPPERMHAATLRTLERLDIELVADQVMPAGWTLKGLVAGREIDIELETLSAALTRMRVSVSKDDSIFRDASTAADLIVQTTKTLDDVKTAAAARPPQSVAVGNDN